MSSYTIVPHPKKFILPITLLYSHYNQPYVFHLFFSCIIHYFHYTYTRRMIKTNENRKQNIFDDIWIELHLVINFYTLNISSTNNATHKKKYRHKYILRITSSSSSLLSCIESINSTEYCCKHYIYVAFMYNTYG